VRRRFVIGFIALLVISGFSSVMDFSSVNVNADSGTDTIHEDYYVAHSISFHSGSSIDISYTMEVTSGPNIDVFFIDSQNYVYLQDGRSFDYYVAMSDLNTMYASNDITLIEYDTYYLIFDNTDVETNPPFNFVDDVAYVSYNIDTEIYYPSTFGDTSGTDGLNWLWILIPLIIIIVVVVAVVAAVLASQRKIPPSIQQYPTQYPPQYPPQQPPYQPPPGY